MKSSEKDAQYLKMLLNQGYNNNDIQHGTYVPTRIHLMASTDSYKGLLRHQSAFKHSITVLSIEGLSEATIYQKITVDEKTTDISEYIMAFNGRKVLEQKTKLMKAADGSYSTQKRQNKQ
eukprot:15357717-Ditylum_brightwellii.AAC.1